MQNYFRELPDGYKQVYCIDAKSKKTSVLFTVVSLFLTVGVLLPLMLSVDWDNFISYFETGKSLLLFELLLFASIFAYIVLHELTHGLVYKICTHEKLTFGFTLTVAFCGVPGLFVRRKPMLFAILAPFVVFTLLFGSLLLVFENPVYWVLVSILFAIHVGGCVGDLYGAIYMIFFNRKKEMLINDTGPKQTFYICEE